MKTKYSVLLIVFMAASIGCIDDINRLQQTTENVTPSEETKMTEKTTIPQSLEQYYEKEPIFLFNMLELAETMMGIVTNFQQKDADNAKKSFENFSQLYTKTSNMVPEWNKYFDTDAVNNLGNALDNGNPEKVFGALDKVGKTCRECHNNERVKVWAKYYWKDFRTININTVNPQEPELPWAVAKLKYLAPAFDGTIVNLKEKQQKDAAESWNQFNTMFSNLEKTCANCHTESPKYFVGPDVKSLISRAGQQITAGNLDDGLKTMQQIGINCYKCHIIHQPAQRLKESLQD